MTHLSAYEEKEDERSREIREGMRKEGDGSIDRLI